jgi:CheY-specific phosphatase CheX
LRAEHVDAILTSAFEVLGKTVDARPERGSPVLRSGEAHSSRELTLLVAIRGDLAGVVYYSMSLATATKLGAVLSQNWARRGEKCPGEPIVHMSRLMAGAGFDIIAGEGCACRIDDPLLVQGFGEPLTAVSPILLIPLYTEYGDIDIGLALQPAASLSAEITVVSVRSAALRETIGDRATEEIGELPPASATGGAGESDAPGEEPAAAEASTPEAQAEWDAALAALEAEEAANQAAAEAETPGETDAPDQPDKQVA